MDLGEIDLLDLDRFQRQEHHAMFTALRAQDPIHWTEEPGGSGFWSLARHADLITINRDAEGFSSEAQGTSIADLEGIDAAFDMRGKMMLWTDPPRHTRYRLLVNKGFTPRMIGLLEQHLRYRAELVVDRVIERGECDFVTDLAAELPLQAIAEVMGVPQEERHLLFGWSNRMIGADDPEFASREGASVDDGQAAAAELYMYAAGLRERRRQDPRDDIVTTLLNAEINGDRLSDEEFEMFILLLAVAGNETTRNATAHGMHALMSNPDEYARLVEDPGVMPLAIEEIVRWATPVMYFRRTAKREITLGGRDISIGDKVVMWHVSANRDETVFEDPFRFDVGRTPKYESRGVVGFGSTVR
jgi:cholest-4-en-3-one 26-monooxygenase